MDTTTPSAPSHAGSDRGHWGADLLSGFLVFLIALPLSLGIAMASNFPPISGILTAVVGGMVASFFGSARLTIKGPAAGLIVIGLGAVNELGNGDALAGYRMALATIVVAAVIQILFSLVKAGALGDFFPSSVVHGMLAAIGVIICSKQLHTLLGVTPEKGGPLFLLAQVPNSIANMNPEVALIGLLSLLVLFGWGYLPWPGLRKIPPQIVVVAISLVLAGSFDLGHEHHYQYRGHDFTVGPNFLVSLPGSLLSAVTFPDFSQVFSGTSIKFIVMFALVGSLESLLSAKAVDALDPLKRRSDMDKDLLAVGVGNLIAGLVGGLPMISEIVRSSANITNGAKTRWSNFFHGMFLAVCVAGVPWLLARIPLTALAAMLIYTGFRLASPREFAKTWRIGREQMVIFACTIVVTVATDLLLGVFAGIVVKAILHWNNGMPIRNTFRPEIQTTEIGDTVYLKVGHAAVFSNYLTIKRQLNAIANTQLRVVVDLSSTRIVDHTVMEKLHEMELDWARDGRELLVTGLEAHERVSAHPLATRRNKNGGAVEQVAS
jgi:MFS superfamily sulfate permease-like transporter